MNHFGESPNPTPKPLSKLSRSQIRWFGPHPNPSRSGVHAPTVLTETTRPATPGGSESRPASPTLNRVGGSTHRAKGYIPLLPCDRMSHGRRGRPTAGRRDED